MANKPKGKDQPNLDDLISLNKAARLSGLSPSYLRILVRRGEIWGQKFGRNWVTTEQTIRDYQARKRKPGRPKKQ